MGDERVVGHTDEATAIGLSSQAAVEKLMSAISTGNVQGLVEVLAPDVVLIADGGGLVTAARKPITGVEKVAAFLARVVELPDIVPVSTSRRGGPGCR